jgi:hypothetical protein
LLGTFGDARSEVPFEVQREKYRAQELNMPNGIHQWILRLESPVIGKAASYAAHQPWSAVSFTVTIVSNPGKNHDRTCRQLPGDYMAHPLQRVYRGAGSNSPLLQVSPKEPLPHAFDRLYDQIYAGS